MKNWFNKETFRSTKGKRKKLAMQIPYLYFLILLGMLYIATSHAAERKAHKIEALSKELQELNWRYMSLKSKVVNQTTLSTLTKNEKVSTDGPPPVIIRASKRGKTQP